VLRVQHRFSTCPLGRTGYPFGHRTAAQDVLTMNTYFGSLLSTEVLLQHKAASWPWRCYSTTNVRIIYNIIMQPIVRLLERTTRYFNRNNVPEVEIRLGTNCIWSNLQHYEGGWCERSHGLYCSIMFKWLAWFTCFVTQYVSGGHFLLFYVLWVLLPSADQRTLSV
jgi:hypothetical protein